VTEHVLEFAKQNGSEYDWYLCGNNQMIKEVEAGLIALGIPAEQMKKDAYY
jgi:ferredoxin-NADP reductase